MDPTKPRHLDGVDSEHILSWLNGVGYYHDMPPNVDQEKLDPESYHAFQLTALYFLGKQNDGQCPEHSVPRSKSTTFPGHDFDTVMTCLLRPYLREEERSSDNETPNEAESGTDAGFPHGVERKDSKGPVKRPQARLLLERSKMTSSSSTVRQVDDTSSLKARLNGKVVSRTSSVTSRCSSDARNVLLGGKPSIPPLWAMMQRFDIDERSERCDEVLSHVETTSDDEPVDFEHLLHVKTQEEVDEIIYNMDPVEMRKFIKSAVPKIRANKDQFVQFLMEMSEESLVTFVRALAEPVIHGKDAKYPNAKEYVPKAVTNRDIYDFLQRQNPDEARERGDTNIRNKDGLDVLDMVDPDDCGAQKRKRLFSKRHMEQNMPFLAGLGLSHIQHTLDPIPRSEKVDRLPTLQAYISKLFEKHKAPLLPLVAGSEDHNSDEGEVPSLDGRMTV